MGLLRTALDVHTYRRERGIHSGLILMSVDSGFILSWKDHDSLRYQRIKHIIEPEAAEDVPGDVALDDLQHDRNAPPQIPTPVGPPASGTPPYRPWEFQSAPVEGGVTHDGSWDPEAFAEPNFDHYDPNARADVVERDGPIDMEDDWNPEEAWNSVDADPTESMVDSLVLTGANPVEARERVYSMLAQKPATFNGSLRQRHHK